MYKKKVIWFLSVVAAALVVGLADAGAWCLAQLETPKENSEMQMPPPPPPSAAITGIAPESPFFFFRRLMRMTPEECELALKEHPVPVRDAIRNKIREYKNMPSQESERNLQILDLRWYLFCGVDIQSDMLEGYIHSVPEDYREIIRERLNRWFSIPVEYRTNILANVKTFAYHRQVGGGVGRGKWAGGHSREMRRRGVPIDAKVNSFPFLTNAMGGMPFSSKGFPFLPPERQGPLGPPPFGKGWGFGLGAPRDVSDFRMEGRPGYSPSQSGDSFPSEHQTSTNFLKPFVPGYGHPDSSNRGGFKKTDPRGGQPGSGKGRGAGPGRGGTPGPKGPMFFGNGPGPNAGPERGAGRWGEPTQFKDVRERRTWEELNNFFGMSPEERDRVIRALPKESREKTRRVMRMLDALPPVERQNSLKILLQISDLPDEERSTYVHSAERWNSLSGDEKRFFKILFMPSSPLPEMPPLPSEVDITNCPKHPSQ
ncbi:MAG: hypothetical protein EOM12_02170 [Verrucomicrobiae bacterium]|nr:hypothetical protein [Verrucomicrobiae bacterium]